MPNFPLKLNRCRTHAGPRGRNSLGLTSGRRRKSDGARASVSDGALEARQEGKLESQLIDLGACGPDLLLRWSRRYCSAIVTPCVGRSQRLGDPRCRPAAGVGYVGCVEWLAGTAPRAPVGRTPPAARHAGPAHSTIRRIDANRSACIPGAGPAQVLASSRRVRRVPGASNLEPSESASRYRAVHARSCDHPRHPARGLWRQPARQLPCRQAHGADAERHRPRRGLSGAAGWGSYRRSRSTVAISGAAIRGSREGG